MKIGLVISGPSDPLVPIQHQLGLTHLVSSLRADASEKDNLDEMLAAKVKSFDDIGLKFSVFEGLGGIEDIKLDRPGADEQMDYAKRLIEACGKNDVRVMCYNWMPVVGWRRTNNALPSRGGSTVTAFDVADEDPDERTYAGEISEATLWKTLDAFLREIIPVCEKWNVKMSLHPDDPPILTPLQGISRIVTSARNYQRAFDIIDSAYNTMTFCQANFSAMGEDIPAAIRRFGNMGKITFVHFRDIRGDKNRFEETWHDDGQTDMYAAMKAYYEVGFDGVARPDHVPTMVGEPNDKPSYAVKANIFAVGYMKGLMEAIEKQVL
jgi:mannonate dehydratase